MKTQHLVTILLATLTSAWPAAAQNDATNPPARPTSPAAADAPPTPQPSARRRTNRRRPNRPPPLRSHPTRRRVCGHQRHVIELSQCPLERRAQLSRCQDGPHHRFGSGVNLQGTVSVVAKQPVNTNDIVDLLNDQLGKNNYAAILQAGP